MPPHCPRKLSVISARSGKRFLIADGDSVEFNPMTGSFLTTASLWFANPRTFLYLRYVRHVFPITD